MLYLLAIILPGLAVWMKGRAAAGIVMLVLQVVAFFTFMIFGIGFILWILLVIAAFVMINQETTKQNILTAVKQGIRQDTPNA